MKKIIIAAKAANNVIGKDNFLPWHLPADLDFFLRTIESQFLIFGRKSLESFESVEGKEIFHKGVKGIVVSRNKFYKSSNFQVAQSVKEALELAEKNGVQKAYILGGGEIYQQTIGLVDRLIITEIHNEFAGDTFFPKIEKSQWQEVSRITHTKDALNPYDYSFVVYEPATGG